MDASYGPHRAPPWPRRAPPWPRRPARDRDRDRAARASEPAAGADPRVPCGQNGTDLAGSLSGASPPMRFLLLSPIRSALVQLVEMGLDAAEQPPELGVLFLRQPPLVAASIRAQICSTARRCTQPSSVRCTRTTRRSSADCCRATTPPAPGAATRQDPVP